MKTLIRIIFLLLIAQQLHAQFLQVTNISGTASYGGVPITISTTGNTGSGGGDCLIAPVPYRVGGAPGNLPGTITFTCGSPVYAIKFYSERIHNTEYVQITVNGTVYTLTPANMLSYTDCHGLFFCILTAGNLAGPVTPDHSAGTFVIKSCTGINSFSIYCNGLVGGSTFYTWVDPSVCVSAGNNSPICLHDTLKLTSTGGDTTATYNWSGPGGFTSTMRNPYIPNASMAAAGIYTLTLSRPDRTDTAMTAAIINTAPVITAGVNSPACFGGTISLTSGPDAPGQTYNWSGPGVFSSVVRNPVITPASYLDTGFYSVVATLNGCNDTATVHVDMARVPIPYDSSSSPVCAGNTLLLFSNDTASSATFNWAGPSGFTSTLQNPTIPVTNSGYSGVFTVTATVGSCTMSDTLLVTIDVNPSIPIINLSPPQCSGSTLVMSLDPASITAGTVYHWSGPNGFSSTLTSPTITNVTTSATGLYSVYGTSGACNTITHTNYVQIDSTPEIPTISSNSPICSGNTLSLLGFSNTSGVHYSWSGPASFTSTMQNPSIINAPANASGNYTVTAVLGICNSHNSTTVVINQTPVAPTMSSNSPVCSGQLLILSTFSTPTGGTYYWSGPNGFSTTVQNPQILNVPVANSGVYSVYEVVNGCTSPTSNLAVIINPTPVVPVATSSSPVCQGDSLYLFATDATPGVTYTWGGPAGFASTLQNPTIGSITPAAQGIYTVTATLGLCLSTGITNVLVTSTPTITASSNSPICSGDSLKLFSNTGVGNTVHWAGPYTFSSISPNPTRVPAIPEYSGVYQVTATEAGGCSSVAFDTVIVNPTPAVPWIPWLTFCQYDYAPPLMAVDATNVLWFPTSAGGTGTAIAPTPSTSVVGVYYFYLNQTLNGCTSKIDSVQVVVHPKPTLTVSPRNSVICPHDTVVLAGVCSDPAATFRWYPSLYLDDSAALTTVARPIANVSYYLVANNTFGCTDTGYADISVNPGGLIQMGIQDSVILYPGESYHIIPNTNCSNITWFPPEGLSSAAISDPVATPLSNTMYIAMGITEHGCVVSDSIYFHINDETFYGIPNAFTPGTGNNNKFLLQTKGIASLNHFRVYDRWGVLLFETRNINEGWDGSYKGAPQPFGVYIYDVEAVSAITGKIATFRGNITLIR